MKNSSTGAVFRCFYSYKNFKYYFTEIINKNNDSVFNLPGKEVGKRVYQLFGALKENNIDSRGKSYLRILYNENNIDLLSLRNNRNKQNLNHKININEKNWIERAKRRCRNRSW